MTSIHPSAIEWKRAIPQPGYFNQIIGRTTAWESRVGTVYQTVTGRWQATHYVLGDCGEHRSKERAMKAVENGETVK